MADWTCEKLLNIFVADILTLNTRAGQIIQTISDSREENREQLRDMLSQISSTSSGRLLFKTPKANRKKAIHRIETIAEDEVTEFEPSKTSTTVSEENGIKEKEADSETSTTTGRLPRSASTKAANNIKKQQQSEDLSCKLRRPDQEDNNGHKRSSKIRERRLKRSKASVSSSDEEKEECRPTKQSKVDERTSRKRSALKRASKTIATNSRNDDTIKREHSEELTPVKEQVKQRTSTMKRKYEETKSSSSTDRDQESVAKKANVTDKTPDTHLDNSEVFTDEDARCKSPLMHSTMIHGNVTTNVDREVNNVTITLSKNINSTFSTDKTITLKTVLADNKIMNSTVVLEKLPPSVCMNETVTLSKDATSQSSSRKNSENWSKISAQNALQDRLDILTEKMTKEQYDALITDDESSPEFTKNKIKLKQKQRIVRSSSSCDDDDVNYIPKGKTASKNMLQKENGMATTKNVKKIYKPNALFSPYAKDSVRKRVEAFEQAGLNCPESVESDAPTRVTRTKTRAMAAAAVDSALQEPQKMTHKSPARAKKIPPSEQMMMTEESKENSTSTTASYKSSQLVPRNDKVIQKQQQRVTPVKPSRLQQPASVSRIYHTPITNTNNSKAMTASRSNIVTNVESFIQQPKTAQKEYSTEKSEEKKRRMEEDGRKKRDEALRVITEEKRRKREEKARRNKLAREANEKREMEKRLKYEEERKEKARLALLMQEKQREEAEKKRLAQLLRAQETEERRKQEEQLRLQRLQEQEEAERQLAEQKRKEQEAAERQQHRRAAEAKAQQEAQTEALRLKAQYMAAQAKAKQYNTTAKQQPTLNYVIDSEPDDDESDDESKPKHTIPSWAKSSVRKFHLAMQEFVPLLVVQSFFDSKKCTPDLTKLFHGIDKNRLKRTSSAIWKTPPRYSMMEKEC